MNMQRALASRKLHEQIVAKNTPKSTPDRERVIQDTMAFLDRTFEGETLRPEDVKRLTLLRIENGNQDLEVVPIFKLATPETLEAAYDRFPSFNDRFFLKKGECLEPASVELC